MNFFDLLQYFIFSQKFEFYIFVIFSTMMVIFRTFNMISASLSATLYSFIFITIIANSIFNITSTYSDITWVGNTFIIYEISVIKLLIISFWFIFYIFLKFFFYDEYFNKNEFKMFSFDIALCGAIYLATANNLLEIFLGLEMLAFPTYTLIGLEKTKEATEAALKYFIYSVYGSLLLIVSFIILFITSGQVSFTELVIFTNPYQSEIAIIMFCTAFLIKLGVGPFYHWAPPVYQAISPSNFVFISTISKVPLLIAFIHISQTSFFLTNTWSYFYINFLLVVGAFMAAKDLLSEKNIRRVMAYTSNINFTIGLLGFFFGLFNAKLFLVYIVLYLLSNLSVYVWHLILNTNKVNKNEIIMIENFNKEDKRALFMLNLSLIMNSGLPPITLFVFKLLMVGNISFWAGQNLSILGLFISIFILFCSLSSYGAYFNILKNVNYKTKSETPDLFEFKRNETVYSFGTFIVVVTIYIFFCTIFFI